MATPVRARDEVGDRSLDSLSDDELRALWDEHGYRPARELLGEHIAYDAQNMTALNEFNLKINPNYWKAISEGMPEDVARLYAYANPGNFLMIYAPFIMSGEIVYDVFARDVVDAFKDDPLSWRTAGEAGMAFIPGSKIARLDKLRNLERALEILDDGRDTRRLADELKLTVNRSFEFPGGGRGGGRVKDFVGPENAIVRGTHRGRVFVTDDQGRVILDITADRVKPVVPGQGFLKGDERKLRPTAEQLGWINELWRG